MKPHWWLIHAHVRQDRIARKLNEAMEGSVYSRTNVAGCPSPSVRSNTTIPPNCDIPLATKYLSPGSLNCMPPRMLTDSVRTCLTSVTVEDENSDGVSGEVPTLRFEPWRYACVKFGQGDALGSRISAEANLAGVKGRSFRTIDATRWVF